MKAFESVAKTLNWGRKIHPFPSCWHGGSQGQGTDIYYKFTKLEVVVILGQGAEITMMWTQHREPCLAHFVSEICIKNEYLVLVCSQCCMLLYYSVVCCPAFLPLCLRIRNQELWIHFYSSPRHLGEVSSPLCKLHSLPVSAFGKCVLSPYCRSGPLETYKPQENILWQAPLPLMNNRTLTPCSQSHLVQETACLFTWMYFLSIFPTHFWTYQRWEFVYFTLCWILST